jgi:tryptophan synthase alpha chain
MSRISRTFRKLKREGRKAFIPYVMAGDPSMKRTEEVVHLLEGCGADIIELGVPFTDPVADGPAIQRAAERALQNGVSLRDVIALVGRLRGSTGMPIILMTYYNPVFRYGEERFVRDAKEAGVDGLIVPDLPPDEAQGLRRLSRVHDLDLIFLLAPTSTPERMKLVVKASRGFIYYVSITGITGARLKLDPVLKASIEAVRGMTRKPVALGFGVSNEDEARAAAEFADGVIVGSAIVRRINDIELGEFLTALRTAIGAAK